MDVLKGEHCSVAICKQFDFLPFTCAHCGKTFCLEHRSQDAHKCTAPRPDAKNTIPQCPICGKLVALISGDSPDVKVSLHIESGCKLHVLDVSRREPACGYSKCKALRAPIRCKTCRKMFCAEHRFESDHKCKGKSVPAGMLSGLSESGRGLLASLGFHRPDVPKPVPRRGAALGSKSATSSHSSAAAKSSTGTSAMSFGSAIDSSSAVAKKKKKSKKELKREAAGLYKAKVRLRTVAKGRESIEAADRFYLEITFDKRRLKTKKLLVMFFNKKQTIGRILDEICDERRIKNKNHIPSAEKLVLDCVRTGGVLPMDVALYLLEPQLMSGDCVYLRYETTASI